MNEQTTGRPHEARDRAWPNTRPRDAATLIVVDTRGPEPRVLMGRRHGGHQFLPDKFVFPGGRIDPADYRISPLTGLRPEVEEKLLIDMKGGANRRRAAALALAAVRETYEETGLLVGSGRTGAGTGRGTRSQVWRAFLEYGVRPDLEHLTFVARAITPPRRPRRYDTRFFCVTADRIARQVDPRDGELPDRQWLTLAQTRAFDLPRITRAVLDGTLECLNADGGPTLLERVPYYFMRRGEFRRHLI